MASRQSRSYDDIMEQKISMLQIACQDDPSLSTIPGLPISSSNKRNTKKLDNLTGTNRSTQYSDSMMMQTPQFSQREDHFNSLKSPSSTLTRKLKEITQDIEKTDRSQKNTSILKKVDRSRPSSSSATKQISFEVPQKSEPKTIIIFDSIKLQEFIQSIKLGQEIVGILFLQDFLIQLNFVTMYEEDSNQAVTSQLLSTRSENQRPSSETLIKQLWEIMMIITYGRKSDNQQMPINEFINIIYIIFDSIQTSGQGDYSNQELVRYIDLKSKVVWHKHSESNYFIRTLSHLNRYLFDEKLPSFDKLVQGLKQLILQNGQNCSVYEMKDTTELPFNSNQDNATILDIFQFSEQRHKQIETNKHNGMQRSYLLYEHAKKLTQKQGNMQVVRAKVELSECTFTPSIQKHQSTINTSNDVVFDRLSKQKNKFVVPVQQDELQGCTFKPVINTQKHQIKIKNIQVILKLFSQQTIPGVDTQMKRLEVARQEKERVQSFYEKQQNKLHEQYTKFDQSSPFKLSRTNENKNDPVVYLDVKVSKARVGRIGIRKGDNVQKLVSTFSKTFTLNNDLESKLEEQIQQVLLKFYG